MAAAHDPVRTCIGCRETFAQQELIRFVSTPQGSVFPDLRNKMPGRGAYTCFKSACIETAVKKQQFQRSLKVSLSSLDAASLKKEVLLQLESQLQGLISLMRKAGTIQAGANMLQEALKKEKFVLLVLAGDISPGRSEKLVQCAKASGVDYSFFATKEELGRWVGKGETSALGIKPGGLADRFKMTFEQYRQLSGEL